MAICKSWSKLYPKGENQGPTGNGVFFLEYHWIKLISQFKKNYKII